MKGLYYFRHVIWLVGSNDGTLSEAIAVYGNINFDGNGNYSLSNAQVCDSSTCNSPSTVKNYQVSGTYSISSSGYGFLKGIVVQNDSVYGLTSPQGIFIGSSTDNTMGYNDLFIAVPVASPAPTNSSFSGTYAMASVDYPGVNIASGVNYTRASTFQLTPDGKGGLGNVTATGFITGNGTTQSTQNFSGLKYSFGGGVATVNFGGTLSATGNLIAGNKSFYLSPDGNLVFGGSLTGWDMIVGVRTGSGIPSFSGLYYQAGVEQDNSTLSKGFAATSSHFGALLALPGVIMGHRRVLSVFNKNVFDYTHADSYTVNANGSYDDPFDHYTFTADGKMGVGIGTGSLRGMNVLLKAPQFLGSGVYIDPTGVLNAGSSAPFTAGLAPGELISIYGTGITSTTVVDTSLPPMLNGIQVMINGRAAPIYGVAHTADYDQVNAVVPLATTEAIASIQVISNGVPSNTVTNFVNSTAPGIFNSLSAPAIQHADYSLVTQQNPVKPGETLMVYLTGLGNLDTSGHASNITAYVGGVQATVLYAGSYSPVAGGYQVNLTVPASVPAGNVYLDISGPDAYNSEVVVPIAGAGGTTSALTPQLVRRSKPQLGNGRDTVSTSKFRRRP